MESTPPSHRKPAHSRRIEFECYRREDGLWDIDASLLDWKPFAYSDRERGQLPPGHPIHNMKLRITIDNDLLVQSVDCDLRDVPFAFCSGASEPLAAIVGSRIGSGWRRSVDQCLGGAPSCTHLRELLYAVATPAFQAISAYREQFEPGAKLPVSRDGRPFFLGGCHSWALDSPVVRRFYPEHYADSGHDSAIAPAKKLTK